MNARQAKNFKIILIALLVGITIFSVFKYLAALKEKYDLLNNLNQVKGQVLALEQEIEKEKELQNALTQENLTIKDALKADKEKFAQLDSDLQHAQKTVEQLTAQIAISQAENTALREEKDKFAQELTLVSQERNTLKARLRSIPELKKTIKEIKMQMRKAKVIIREIAKTKTILEGNRGFLVKNGKNTFPTTKIRIEVMPAPASK